MRILLAILASMIVTCTTAQTHLPVPVYFSPTFVPFDNSSHKLQLRPYASINTGIIFYNGAVTYISAPVGLMLVRPLNNNLAAFSSLSVAPTAFSSNSFLSAPGMPYPYGPSGYGLGLNTQLTGGLMYTNDAHTFSISGSISVERGSYPAYYPANHHPANYPKSY